MKKNRTLCEDVRGIGGEDAFVGQEERKKEKRSADKMKEKLSGDIIEINDNSPVDQPPAKKAKNSPLPSGYVCKACGKMDHAIYNCPVKIPKKSKSATTADASGSGISNMVVDKEKKTSSKTIEGRKDKSELTVYVSGLPFKSTVKFLSDLFHGEGLINFITKPVPFDDNPNKCRGIAFVTFTDAESVTKSLALSGRELAGGKTLHIERVTVKPTQALPSSTTNSKDEDAGEQSKNSSSSSGAARGKKYRRGGNQSRCFRCGGLHDAATCVNARVCYRCLSIEHLSKDCPRKIGAA